MKRWWVGAALLTLAACRPGAPRPIPMAFDEVLKAPQNVVFQTMLQEFADQGLPLRSAQPDPGILETDYFDVSQFRQGAQDYPPNERLVRIRVLVGPDSVSLGTRMGVQVIYTPFGDPMGSTRRGERAVPKNHPVMEMVKAMVEDLKNKTRGF